MMKRGRYMDLRILSGAAANGLATALTEAFGATTGMGVTGDFGAVGGMRDRVLAGEWVDPIILTRAIIDALAAGGHVDPASGTDLGEVVTGVAVRSGAAFPDVSTADGLRTALLRPMRSMRPTRPNPPPGCMSDRCWRHWA
ncbi:MAG: molybdate transport system substrate-binding protein [Paracoccaceae bacterium]|jgi:molybdate transport system substrate-binding protein